MSRPVHELVREALDGRAPVVVSSQAELDAMFGKGAAPRIPERIEPVIVLSERMAAYRHASPTDQVRVTESFDAVRTYVVRVVREAEETR